MRFLLTCLSFAFVLSAFSTTWDEPWQEEILKTADSFFMGKVITADEENGIEVKILKNIAGERISENIKVTGFYLLHLCSGSAEHGPEFRFDEGETCYFFIKKNQDGEYCLPTPSSGFARINDDGVIATYRHSYHMALVPVDSYEASMTAIFNHYHNLPYDEKYMSDLVRKALSHEPAGFEEADIQTFYAQHVALESIFHLELTGYENEILPFLKDTANFHNQISAARALTRYNSDNVVDELISTIDNPDVDEFVKVMAIFSLQAKKPKDKAPEIKALLKNASHESFGFGGSIMDPRVCTFLPSVYESLEILIDELD